MKYILLILLTLTFSCTGNIEKKSFNTDESFYLKWNESTENEGGKCCADSIMNPLIQKKIKGLFRYRSKLFEILTIENRSRKSYYIEEHFSEGNEFSIHSMTVYLNGKGKTAKVNYKGEVSIDTVYYQQKRDFEFNSNCCPFTQEEFNTYEGYIPLKCVTVVNFDNKEPFFKVTLSTK